MLRLPSCGSRVDHLQQRNADYLAVHPPMTLIAAVKYQCSAEQAVGHLQERAGVRWRPG